MKPKKEKQSGAKGLEKTSMKTQLKPGEGFLDENGLKKLERVDLLEIELLRVKAEERQRTAQKMHLEADKMEFNTTLAIKALRRQAMVVEQQVHGYKDEQSLLLNRLGEKYGVDFKKSTYDDETGIVLMIDETNK